MYILGFNCYGHDASAALFKDNKIIGAVSEERFTRKKQDGDFPVKAIEYLLSCENINFSDLDAVGYFYNPFLCLNRKAAHFIFHPDAAKASFEIEAVLTAKVLRLKKKIRRIFGLSKRNNKPKFYYIEHHLAHAASTFFCSEFDQAAILSVDGMGEWCTTLWATGKDNKITPLKREYFPNSLGFLYSAVTEYLGFDPIMDEYKVMGLASYGQPNFYDKFKKIVNWKKDSSFSIDMDYFKFYLGLLQPTLISPKFVATFGPARKEGNKIENRHADIAASLQKILEETVLRMVNFLYDKTKLDKLCIAGGVGLNCAMNGRIVRETGFKEIFVQPASHDAGTALGNALYIRHVIMNQKRDFVLQNACLGPEYTNDYIEKILSENKLKFIRSDNIEEIAAGHIVDNKIIGWFQSRMEFGPRALGSRSILANPMKAEMKDIVNEQIKHREEFRPFAPSVLEEFSSEYFQGCGKSPYMTIVYNVIKDKAAKIPAVTHVDGTARVQTVNKEINPRYWNLIDEFYKKTGVPVILNTSFNVKGEPIVCSPEDAIRCFYTTGMDYLAIGDFLVSK